MGGSRPAIRRSWTKRDSSLSFDASMSITTEIRIAPAAIEHVAGFYQCLDSVARERSGLAITEAFPLDQLRTFVEKNIEEGMPNFFALDGGRVVGWADIRREERPDARHR